MTSERPDVPNRPVRYPWLKWLLITSLACNVAGVLVVVFKLARRLTSSTIPVDSYRDARIEMFSQLPPADIMLVGDSHTDWAEWHELLGRPAANRGISGETTEDLLGRLRTLLTRPPRVFALQVGANDLLRGASAETTDAGVRRIVAEVRRHAPGTRVLVTSLLPVTMAAATRHRDINERIARVDAALENAAAAEGYEFIDLRPGLTLADGSLDPQYSADGVHLRMSAYREWAKILAAAIDRPPVKSPASTGEQPSSPRQSPVAPASR